MKLSFKSEEEIETFSDKKKTENSSAADLALEEMLKEAFQGEKPRV